jgi:hypothetical protein
MLLWAWDPGRTRKLVVRSWLRLLKNSVERIAAA